MRHDASQVVDAAVPLLVGAIVAVGVITHAAPATRSVALALGLAAAATLAARRRWPLVTLGVSGGLVLVSFAVAPRAGVIAVVAPGTALYSLALTRGRLPVVLAATAAAAAVVAADTFIAGGHPHQLTLETVGHVTLVAVPLLAAEALRNRRSYVKLLLERLELAQRMGEEEAQRRVGQERLRIARDLHDVVAHTLTTINVQAGVAAHLLDRQPGYARTALTTIADASHDALEELRVILSVLRADDESGPRHPAPRLEDLGELIEQTRRAGLDVRVDIDGERPDRVPDTVQLAAFRIVQESLTNARRHATGGSARVRLTVKADRLLLAVENGGERPSVDGEAGMGILGMRERAAALGGTLDADRSPNGFRVAAELPYDRNL